jgi:hypothetical protein
MPIISLLLANWKWVLLGLMVAAIGYLNWRLESCKRVAEEYKVMAEAREKALGTQIEVQNRAVEALEAEGKARQARAAEGLKKAQEGTKAARSEAERLKTLAKAENAPTGIEACPAGAAVAEIRKGLGL